MSTVRTYNLFLDSAYANVRSPVTDTRDLTFYLRKAIEPIVPSNRFRVRVNTMELPFSFSQVNNTNNQVVIKYAQGLSEVTLGTITIDSGNYDIVTLLALFDLKVNALLAGKTLVSTFDQSTGKSSLKFTDPLSGSLRFYFGSSIVLTMIGFDPVVNGTYVSIPGSSSGTTTTSVKNVNVCPTTCVYVSSRSFTQTRNYEALTNGMDVTDVIGKVQLTTLPQTYLMYMNYTGEFVEVNNKSITEINLYLSTNLVDFLDMSDMRWSVHLVLEEVGVDPSIVTVPAVSRLDEIPGETKDNIQDTSTLIQKKKDLENELEMYKNELETYLKKYEEL